MHNSERTKPNRKPKFKRLKLLNLRRKCDEIVWRSINSAHAKLSV